MKLNSKELHEVTSYLVGTTQMVESALDHLELDHVGNDEVELQIVEDFPNAGWREIVEVKNQ